MMIIRNNIPNQTGSSGATHHIENDWPAEFFNEDELCIEVLELGEEAGLCEPI